MLWSNDKDSKATPPDVDKHVLEFQADAVELEKQTPPRCICWLYKLLCFLFVFALTWSILGKVDKIVTARGKLISTGKQVLIQPLINSIIKEFHVEVGQVVSAGQVLVTLDPTFAQADESQLRVRIDNLAVLIRRLESELSGETFVVTQDMPPREAALQLQLYNGRQEEYRARLASYDSRLQQLHGNIESFSRQLESLNKQLEIHASVLEMRQKLLVEGADSRLSVLAAESQFAETKAKVENINNSLVSHQQQVSQIIAERDAFVNNWRNTAASALVDSRSSRDTLSEQYAKASHYRELSELSSPVDAVVLDLGHFSVGSVAKEGDPIMTLVPLNLPLEAEVSIDTKDVGYVRRGDSARIKLDAFPFQRHGTLDGQLRVVSEDAFLASSTAEKPTYQARLELLTTTLHDVSPNTRFLPGMTLSAEIVVGQRRVITYLAYPLIRGLDESIREP